VKKLQKRHTSDLHFRAATALGLEGVLLGIALGSVFSHYLLLTLGLVTLPVINFFATEFLG